MSFFTPIQISKKPFMNQHFYNFDVFNQNLFEMTHPHIESISDQKRKIIHWYMLDKINQVKKNESSRKNYDFYLHQQIICLPVPYHVLQKVTILTINMNQFLISYDHQTDEFDLQCGITPKSLPKSYCQAEDELLSNLQIMSRYTQFDSVTFKQQILNNIQKIFDLFQIIGDTIVHSIDIDDYYRLKKMPNSYLFYDNKEGTFKKTIGMWIIQVLMKQISMRYFNYCQQQKIVDQITIEKNQIKQKQKQYQRYWKNISQQQKTGILNRVLKLQLCKMCEQHRMMVKVTKNGFPLISKNVKGGIRLIDQIMKCDQKDIYNLLVFTELEDSLQTYSYYKYHIFLEIQSQIKKQKEIQLSKVMKKKKNKKKKTLNINNNNAEKVQKIQKIQQNCIQIDKKSAQIQQNSQEKMVSSLQDSFSSSLENQPFTNIKNQIKQQQKIKQNDFQIGRVSIAKNNDKKSKKNSKRLSNSIEVKNLQEDQRIEFDKNQVKSNKASDTTNDQYEVDSGVTSDSTDVAQNLLMLQQKYQICQYEKVSDQNTEKISQNSIQADPLQKILTNSQKTLNFYNKQRKIILNRINHIFVQLNLSFKVYGSCAYQAALPSSDIDIVVDPSIVNFFYFQFSNYREKINKSLKYLKDVFQKLQWTSQFVHLPAATVPLLTFKVNTSIPFGQDSKNFKLNNKKPLNKQVLLSVDFTVEPYVNMIDEIPMHFGIQSTELVKDWMHTYPKYQNLFLLMKMMLKNLNLNKSYNGGLGSFTLAVILAVFYKNRIKQLSKSQKKQIKDQKCYGLFIEFCDFLEKFSWHQSYMNIQLQNPILQKQEKMKRQVLVIINPINNQNLTQRCFLFEEWRQALKECKKLKQTNLFGWQKWFMLQDFKNQEQK